MMRSNPVRTVPLRPLCGRSVWVSSELEDPAQWTVELSHAAVSDLLDGIGELQDRGFGTRLPIEEARASEVRLPVLGPVLDRLSVELEQGLGFQLVRGFPVEQLSETQAAMMFWLVGSYLGTAVSGSKEGERIIHVRDVGNDIFDPAIRGYTTRARLMFHTDRTDVVALCCLQRARHGGASRVVSAPAVYNRILELRPDLLEVLCRPYCFDLRGEGMPGYGRWAQLPIFGFSDEGAFAVRYVRDFIHSAQRFEDAPPFSYEQIVAMDFLDAVADSPEVALDMDFEPGDIQFLNSYVTLHARTPYEDHPDLDRKRHLLRLWLSVPNSRPLPRGFLAYYGTVEAGELRGGVPTEQSGVIEVDGESAMTHRGRDRSESCRS